MCYNLRGVGCSLCRRPLKSRLTAYCTEGPAHVCTAGRLRLIGRSPSTHQTNKKPPGPWPRAFADIEAIESKQIESRVIFPPPGLAAPPDFSAHSVQVTNRDPRTRGEFAQLPNWRHTGIFFGEKFSQNSVFPPLFSFPRNHRRTWGLVEPLLILTQRGSLYDRRRHQVGRYFQPRRIVVQIGPPTRRACGRRVSPLEDQNKRRCGTGGLFSFHPPCIELGHAG